MPKYTLADYTRTLADNREKGTNDSWDSANREVLISVALR